MRRDILSACCTVCAAVIMTASAPASNAQAPNQGTTAPPAQPSPPHSSDDTSDTKSSDVPLSKKLDESKGVLKPPQGVDPGIHQPAPAHTGGDKMPVIVPPGEPGGDQSVQPK